ncbi:porin family protein [Algoriphagus namhaensis]
MKKIFLIALVSLISASLYAQNVNFGIRGGASFTTLGGEVGELADSKFRVGFHAGAAATFGISENLDFEAGLQYANKGAKGFDGSSNTVIRKGYLDLPLLLKVTTSDKLFLLFGAQPSFLISSSLRLGDGQNQVIINGQDLEDLWEGFDAAVVIGLGTNLSSDLTLQATYEHGFVNISELSDDIYNRGIKLTLGKNF